MHYKLTPIYILITLLTTVLCFDSSGSEKLDSNKIWIAIEEDSSYITIQPYFFNQDSGSVAIKYELTVNRIGSGGQAKSTQSGKAEIPGNTKKPLSQVNVNFQDGDKCEARLRIFKGKWLIYDKVKEYPARKKSN